jgi:hypothetical protein
VCLPDQQQERSGGISTFVMSTYMSSGGRRIDLSSVFALPVRRALDTITVPDHTITFQIHATAPTAACPRCGTIASRIHIPSRARIAAFFKYAKLTRRYNRHTELPEPAAATEGIPHDESELDAQGPLVVENLGKVCLVNVIDTTSRLKIESYPCMDTTNPVLETDQLVLLRAWRHWLATPDLL